MSFNMHMELTKTEHYDRRHLAPKKDRNKGNGTKPRRERGPQNKSGYQPE